MYTLRKFCILLILIIVSLENQETILNVVRIILLCLQTNRTVHGCWNSPEAELMNVQFEVSGHNLESSQHTFWLNMELNLQRLFGLLCTAGLIG